MNLNNIWFLTGFLVAITTAGSFALTYLLPIDIRFSSIIILVASTMFLGYYYTSKTRKVMHESLRKGVAIRYTIIQVIIGAIILYLLLPILSAAGIFGSFITAIMIGLVIFVAFLNYFIVYFALKTGGESYLRGQSIKKKRR